MISSREDVDKIGKSRGKDISLLIIIWFLKIGRISGYRYTYRRSQLRSSHSLLNIKLLRDFIGPSTETRMYHPQKRDRSCLNRVATALQQDQSPQLGRRQADSCNLNGAWVENQLISRRALSISPFLPFLPSSLFPSKKNIKIHKHRT